MNISRTIYQTKGGDLTTDRSKGAFVFLSAGKAISPAELKKNPALKEFLPIEKFEKSAEKRIEKSANKRIMQSQNKRRK